MPYAEPYPRSEPIPVAYQGLKTPPPAPLRLNLMSTNRDAAVRRAFGAVIKRLRKNAGLSQEAFGEVAGLHRTYISMMERGIKAPTVVTLVDLAEALGMGTADLMGLFDRELEAATGRSPAVTGVGVSLMSDERPARHSGR